MKKPTVRGWFGRAWAGAAAMVLSFAALSAGAATPGAGNDAAGPNGATAAGKTAGDDLPTPLAGERVLIPSAIPGIRLLVGNKHPAGRDRFSGDRILLFVHGATYPAESTFDLALDGRSMMDLIAATGWDVYFVDIRGYGGSDKPPEMAHPPESNHPIVTTAEAATDVAATVDYIMARRGVDRINLMGWSWGTSIMGLYTVHHPAKVNRLVLYAPQWITDKPSPVTATPGPLGAYRTVSRDAARERWLKGVPEEKKAGLIPAGWFETWAKATWPDRDTPLLAAPNGVVADSRAYWSRGLALYHPEDITVPTLVIHAEWDADLPSDLSHRYFARLENAPYKRFVELGQGTHTVMLERNRMQFFHEVMGFLDEARPLDLN